MDLVQRLPMSKRGHDYVFVVVYQFSKKCMLMPYKKIINGHEAVELFFSNVWVHFNRTYSIASNKDSRFLGRIWTTLWEKMDAKLKQLKTLHQQMNGQTNVVNKTFIQLLRGFNKRHPRSWDEHKVSF
jgi:hypothetical protein